MRGDARRRPVEPRRVIFIGVEGKNDRAFAQFIQFCCNGEGLHLHLNVTTGSGGDSVSVVREAARHLTRLPTVEGISATVWYCWTGTAIRKTCRQDVTPKP